ncbi:GntR family transcriptional regulator [Mesorhizobium sp. M3A.F.Ca.ET.201.01.1.1]|uniref:GntR family transcriptional regulator n=1 Tax=Mesorhizobium sp. M3A.F.Ca.ET.201.01.1.1 TaxID=2563946 RepID=UPI002484CD33|nr:GntR family transcriptional regulator [Mesorhizobium sp. M3A.F.Ca.ET.201.01.1.1]
MKSPPPPARSRQTVFDGEAPELRKETLHQQAYEALKRAIMGGRMRPGHAVSLRSLAAELGVSPMPVRDALNRLVTQRALELLSNRTVRVPLMTREKFQELTAVRCHLEGQLGLRATSAIPKQQISALAKKNGQMNAAAESGSVEDFLHLNFEFHFMLYEHSKSEVTLPIVESLWLQAGPFLNEHVRNRGFGISATHHEEIIAGLREGNARKVQEEVEADIRDAANSILEYALSSD